MSNDTLDLDALESLHEARTFWPGHVDHPLMVGDDPWWYVTTPGRPCLADRMAAFACEEDAVAYKAVVLATPALLARARRADELEAAIGTLPNGVSFEGACEVVARLHEEASELHGQHDALTLRAVRAEAALRNILASASPNERDHPSMFKAWAAAMALLGTEGANGG
jgi:hypothetical protein